MVEQETSELRPVSQTRRPTIGLLTIWSEFPLWLGAVDAARAHSVNLICVDGGKTKNSEGVDEYGNVLYKLINPENLEGLFIWGGSGAGMGEYLDPEAMAAFVARYAPLPIVNYEGEIAGVPNIFTDVYEGMCSLVTHLIEVHDCQRIACIWGPKGHYETEVRYQAYCDTLAKHNLPLDPQLISSPVDFVDGETPIALFMDERELRPGVDFDAVAATNIFQGVNAVESLQARGVRVPEDVAVVTFDDMPEAEYATPPLTTARKPFYEVGMRGVEMVLEQLQGQPVSERETLPVPIVVRQSCGCPVMAVADMGHGLDGASLGQDFAALPREAIVQAMKREVEGAKVELAAGWAAQLLEVLIHDVLDATSETFSSLLRSILQQVVLAGGCVTLWHRMISLLRRQMLPYLTEAQVLRAEDLWHKARVLIGDIAVRSGAQRGLRAEEHARVLRGLGQELITTFDMEALLDVLAQGLPALGIPSAYLVLYEDSQRPMGGARLVLAYDERGRLDLGSEGRYFPTAQLVPPEVLPQRQHSMLLTSLNFQHKPLGFLLLEIGPRDVRTYAALRGQISSALYGALLLEARERAEAALEIAYVDVERQVAERTAELARETAERERLQQEVIEAQQATLRELSSPVIPVMDRIIIMPLIGSIDSMRARDIMRALLRGIREHRARFVILDVTGVSLMDTGIVNYLNKTIQAARLKGAQVIVTGISDMVAESIVDLGIDWDAVETLADLQTGLRVALGKLGKRLI